MIKIYGMSTCIDCINVEKQVAGNDKYQIIDIGKDVKNLKDFLHLRDKCPVFDGVKRIGAIGIPCFVLEDGTVTLKPEDAMLQSQSPKQKVAPSCNIDGSGC